MNKQAEVWISILVPNLKGEYIHINKKDGRITYARKVTHLPCTVGRTSVAEVRHQMFVGKLLDEWFLKPYLKWEKKFAKEQPDLYNQFINMPFEGREQLQE